MHLFRTLYLDRASAIIIGTNHVLSKLNVFIRCALKTYANTEFSRSGLTAINSLPFYLDDLILFIGRDYNTISWLNLLYRLQEQTSLADVKCGAHQMLDWPPVFI